MVGLEDVSLYDVTLKAIAVLKGSLFVAEVAARKIESRPILDLLGTEFSRIPKIIADYIARVGPDELIHIEFQSGNDKTMRWRMLEYYGEIVKSHSDPESDGPTIHQFVIYIGRSRMRMEREIKKGHLAFSYDLLDIRKLSAAKDKLSGSRNWGDRVLSLLCTPVADNDEWHTLLMKAAKLPDRVARQVVFWIWVFARLRKLEANLVREIEDMALHFNVSDDPVFRPAIDRAATSMLVDVVIDFFDEGELPIEMSKIEGLRLLSPHALRALVRSLPRHPDPNSLLNEAIGYLPMTPGE